jgi:hypothetical protein
MIKLRARLGDSALVMEESGQSLSPITAWFDLSSARAWGHPFISERWEFSEHRLLLEAD